MSELDCTMSNAVENNSPTASDHKSHFHATNDESIFSQTSTIAGSPLNSFIVEYEIGAVNIYNHDSKEPNVRLKELTASGEHEQPISLFSRPNNIPAMQPPPAQVMGEYDPNRIPGSVFCNKNTSTVDWSIQSNESLFSIYMGNASFNKDHHAFLQKSQELPRLDENINGKQDHLLHHTATVVLPGTLDDLKKADSTGTAERVSTECFSTPRNSNGSNSGVPAFSFPILDNVDIRNSSIGKLSTVKIHKQQSYLETAKVAPESEIVVNSQADAAAATTIVKSTSWFSFSCCRG